MLDAYGRSVEHGRLWRDAHTLAAVGELTARWLQGAITYQAAYFGPSPDAETRDLVGVLAAANRAGYVTDFSQPGVPLAGGRGQRASVSGYCAEEAMARLSVISLPTDLVVITFPPGTESGGQVAVSLADGRECTWLGLPAGPADIDHDYGGDLSPAGLLALRNAWQVHLIDPVWGRDDLLWDTLRTFTAAAEW
jgi:hypothetical protein